MSGSKNSSPSSSRPGVEYMLSLFPIKSGTEEGSYQTKSQISYHDKQSGSYGRATNMEKKSSGEFQWKNGTSGTKSECKRSQTLRFGNKNGYTEVYNEQRVRHVKYHNRCRHGYRYQYDRVWLWVWWFWLVTVTCYFGPMFDLWIAFYFSIYSGIMC